MHSVMNIFFIFELHHHSQEKGKRPAWSEKNGIDFWPYFTLTGGTLNNIKKYDNMMMNYVFVGISGWLQLVRLLLYLLVAGKISRLGIIPTIESSSLCDAIVHTAHLCNSKEKKRKKDSFRFFLANKRGNSCKNGPISRPELFLHQLNMQPLQNVVLGEYLFWCF